MVASAMRTGVPGVFALLLVASCATTAQSTQTDGDVADGGAIDAIRAPDVPPADTAPLPPVDVPPIVDAPPVVDAPPGRDIPPATDRPATDTGTGDAYVVELAVAEQGHQCALLSDGTVRCRGSNDTGALGIGSTERREGVVTVPGLPEIVHVATAGFYGSTYAIDRDGFVWSWGSNHYHMLGTGHDGDEMCPGFSRPIPCRTTPTRIPDLSEVVQIAPEDFAVCAVRRDGSVWCWGEINVWLPRDGGSPIPIPVSDLVDVTGLWSRDLRWVMRHRDGHYSTTYALPGVVPPVGAEMGDGNATGHTCFRLPDATVRCFGLNPHGKVGYGSASWPEDVEAAVDPGLTGVRSVSTGAYHTCAVLDDGTLRCWGDGSYGGLGFEGREDCVGISMPTMCATTPTLVPGIDRVERVFLGVWGACALRADHDVFCWGSLGEFPRTSTPRLTRW